MDEFSSLPTAPDDAYTPVSTSSHPSTPPVSGLDAGGVHPYAAFNLPAPALEPVSQVDALMADEEIAGYIKSGAQQGWGRKKIGSILGGLSLSLFFLVLLALLLPGNLLSRRRLPVPEDTPKPRLYERVAELPILFRDSVKTINDDFLAGNRWQPAYEKLRNLLREGEEDGLELPRDVRTWGLQEMLVLLASKEISPDAFPPEYPDQAYALLSSTIDKNAPLPFRAGAAYAKLLAARPPPKGKNDGKESGERTRLLGVLARLRGNFPELMDKDREMLILEAEQHIAHFPAEYGEDNRYLDYHWRRAAHAINRLYELFGKHDRTVRGLDRRRWQAVYRYFDFTLFTWDPGRVGRLKSITLDGTEYTRPQVGKEIEEQ